MQRSIYLAKLIGPVAVAISLGLLFNLPIYRVMAGQFLHDYALIYISGIGALAAGIAIVLAHNVWEGDWRLIITLFGWLATLGGICRIVAPQVVERIGLHIFNHPVGPMIGGFVVLVLGCVLSYFGYSGEATAPRHAPSKRKRSTR
jgi:hypothetical protein